MSDLLVSFLFKLDKVHKNKNRSWEQFYVKNFSALCAELSKHQKDFLVFSDDPQIRAVATLPSYTNIRYVYAKKDSFKEYQRLAEIREARKKRWTPDVENPEYICLQMSKFEALHRANILWPHDRIAWIDGGLRDANRDFTIRWSKDERIRVCADSPMWFRKELIVATVLGCTSIMGGCFGGTSTAINWLYEESFKAQQRLLDQGLYTNDQGMLTILAYNNPNRFLIKPQYKLYWGFYTDAFWSHITQALDDGIQGSLYYHYTTFLVLTFIIVLAYYLLKSYIK